MTTLAFDTHKAVKALQEAGADEPLAEAVVATVGEAVGGNVATKADLAEVQAGLEGEIAAVRTEIAEVKAELKSEIVTLREDMLKSQQDLSNSIQGVYRLMVVATLTITSTIIGAAIALVRYLAP